MLLPQERLRQVLNFLASIFDHLLKSKSDKGIRAVIVYPMNALINSQSEEIKKFKDNYQNATGKQFPITYAQYTGQEGKDERERIKNELPDIILTNYMMLELILTRSQEYIIRNSMYDTQSTSFLMNSIPTEAGKARMCLLIRCIKAQAQQKISCIGTSATMVSGGNISERKEQVARVATQIFGVEFTKDQIINESLARCFEYSGTLPKSDELRTTIAATINPEDDYENLENALLPYGSKTKLPSLNQRMCFSETSPCSFLR